MTRLLLESMLVALEFGWSLAEARELAGDLVPRSADFVRTAHRSPMLRGQEASAPSITRSGWTLEAEAEQRVGRQVVAWLALTGGAVEWSATLNGEVLDVHDPRTGLYFQTIESLWLLGYGVRLNDTIYELERDGDAVLGLVRDRLRMKVPFAWFRGGAK